MLWFKALHIIFMVAWFAGLFYLPRLFVYHAMTDDQVSINRFKIMERKLLIITHIGMALTWVFGIAMLITYAWDSFGQQFWLQAKLVCLVLLTIYSIWCARLVRKFREDRNTHTHIWYRWFNEVPALFLIVIVILAVIRPFS